MIVLLSGHIHTFGYEIDKHTNFGKICKNYRFNVTLNTESTREHSRKRPVMKKRVLAQTKGFHMNLNRNPRHNFAARHAMAIYNSNSVYSFIPKNGCSTMRLSVALANGAISNIQDFNWIHNNNQTFQPDLKMIMSAEYTFVILRNPFDRLASVYLDKIVGKEIDAWNLRDQLNREINLDKLNFAEFVNYIRKPRLLNTNIHWRQQSDFLLYEKYDDYFMFEDFEKMTLSLEANIDFEVVDSRELIGHHVEQFDQLSGEYSNVPAQEIFRLKLEGRCPSHKSLYSKELKEIVRNVYSKDFDLIEEANLVNSK